MLVFFGALALLAATAQDPFARSALCSFGVCFYSPKPEFWNSLVHTLSAGSAVSVLFYWVLVQLPHHQKRERLKRIFAKQYRSFKLECIDIFLVLSASPQDNDTAKRLLDLGEFRAFFKQTNSNEKERWDCFLNGLNGYYLDALARKMEHLRDEFRIFLLAVESDDEELLELLKRFTQYTHYNVTRSEDYDEIKSLSGYFWQLFAGWSVIDGYSDDDAVLKAIQRI
ncbi:hypothetical protein [Maricaulis sp.]|uniref:hypothetical protein n=1 Tax=Maricaulis sp. TaxID=1486257 RepID=UPI001B2F0F09|nr:hypothetical protein [Maricaulis sp.]MBO6765612.1 hypothetical protein [Maricaulis sp.]